MSSELAKKYSLYPVGSDASPEPIIGEGKYANASQAVAICSFCSGTGWEFVEKKLTILTTNYLDEPQSSADETLADRIGARLRSRLYQMCTTMIVEGEDYRRAQWSV